MNPNERDDFINSLTRIKGLQQGEVSSLMDIPISRFLSVEYASKKCGNERYSLVVHAPTYKEKMFGKAGGR